MYVSIVDSTALTLDMILTNIIEGVVMQISTEILMPVLDLQMEYEVLGYCPCILDFMKVLPSRSFTLLSV